MNNTVKIPSAPVDLSVNHKSAKIITTDAKYNMYINALPTKIRQIIFDHKINPRDVYVDYRKIGKDKIVDKYLNYTK